VLRIFYRSQVSGTKLPPQAFEKLRLHLLEHAEAPACVDQLDWVERCHCTAPCMLCLQNWMACACIEMSRMVLAEALALQVLSEVPSLII
jgi:hypothetical protein